MIRRILPNFDQVILKIQRQINELRFAKFLLEFSTTDEKIDQMPLLITMQRISLLTPDKDFPPDCEDNVVAHLEWDISNKDIRDAKAYLEIAFEKRINYTE